MYKLAAEERLPLLIETVREFCALIERVDQLAADELLESAACLLRRLQAILPALPKPLGDGSLQPLVDLETRFALFRRIRDRLGDCDPYWMEYDQMLLGQGESGSLADDLTDIYFDLLRGLQRLEEGKPISHYLAVCDWRHSYDLHWGEHLVDAERHLLHLLAHRSN